MLIYLLAFSLSFIFAHLASKSGRSRGNIAFWVFSGLSIFCLVLIAGLRDYSIGIDVKNYLEFPIYWKGACASSSLLEYLKYYLADGNTEILFALLMGIIAKTTGAYRVFLFLTHLIIITCIYIGAYRQKKYIHFEFVILFFCLLFFSHSMNIMRQYIAMSIVFAFFADLEERKFVRYSVSVLVATLFHTSALLLFLPMFYYIILYGWKEPSGTSVERMIIKADKSGILRKLTMKDTSFKKKLVLCVCVFIGEMFLTTVFSFFISKGFLNDKYTYYLESDEVSTPIIVSGLLIIELIGVAVVWKDMRRKYPHASFWVICTFTDLAFQQLSSQMAFGKRIAGSFSLLNMLTLALMISSPKKQDKRLLVGLFVIVFCLMYWGYIYIFRNASQTYPYKFGF
ncbi:MAG: EpsG family protein [Oscillospiraceae bacterium]|nr:EpsG family protein [Oscillospiraceae bacterium]